MNTPNSISKSKSLTKEVKETSAVFGVWNTAKEEDEDEDEDEDEEEIGRCKYEWLF